MSVASGKPGVGALYPYYGGKRTLGPRIIAEFGVHAAFFEVFCGSLAVTLAKRPAPMETANDLFGYPINLGRVLASDRWADLYARIERTMIHEDLFIEARERYVGEDLPDVAVAPSVDGVEDVHVEAAYWSLVYAWQAINGVFGTGRGNVNVAKRYTPGGGHTATRWRSVGQSIPWWHERLRSVLFVREDGLRFAERIADDDGVVLYLDPPYLRKGDNYVHDMTMERHAELAEVLDAKRKARVLVSYYDEPELDELYSPDRWTKLRLPAIKGLVNQGLREKGGRFEAPEVLLINGPSLTQGGLFS